MDDSAMFEVKNPRTYGQAIKLAINSVFQKIFIDFFRFGILQNRGNTVMNHRSVHDLVLFNGFFRN